MKLNEKYSWMKHLDFEFIDLLCMLLSFYIAYFIKFRTFNVKDVWGRFIIFAVLLNIIIYFIYNPYSGIFRRRYYFEIGKVFTVVLVNALGTTLILFVLKVGADFSREIVIITYILYFLSSLVAKYIWKQLIYRGVISFRGSRKTSLVLVSTVENAERDIHSVYSTESPLYDIKAVCLAGCEEGGIPDHFTYTDGVSDVIVPVMKGNLADYVLENDIDTVLLTVPAHLVDKESCTRLIANGVEINLAIEPLLSFRAEEQYASSIGINRTIRMGMFSTTPSQTVYLVIKRLFDILCGLVGTVMLIPVMIIVKAAYLLSGDNANILYRQKRIGQNGKPIRIWKFRSMVPDADEILEQLLKDEKYHAQWEAEQKLEDDPRITKVGSILRKTSIDEIPQLINVLAGDMSLIGPRPLVEGELEAHNGLKLYQKVKPGITGWWGCNGRSNINYRERLELEYYYVKNCSFYLDFLCIIRTILAVLKRSGAK